MLWSSTCSWTKTPIIPHLWPCWLGLMGVEGPQVPHICDINPPEPERSDSPPSFHPMQLMGHVEGNLGEVFKNLLSATWLVGFAGLPCSFFSNSDHPGEIKERLVHLFLQGHTFKTVPWEMKPVTIRASNTEPEDSLCHTAAELFSTVICLTFFAFISERMLLFPLEATVVQKRAYAN